MGLISLLETLFGTRQYPKVQKFTKLPFPATYTQKIVLLIHELIEQIDLEII